MSGSRRARLRALSSGLVAAFAAMLASPAVPDPGPPRPPNLLLVVVDDLGWSDTSVAMDGAPGPINRRFRTPHLEALAARGMRFSNAYASAPVCTPTRTSLMTGMSPGQSRITYWTLHRDRDNSSRFPGLRPPAWRTNGLEADETTLSRLLSAAGYRTIHVGKAHFGARDTPTADPRALGFDVNVAGHAAGGPGSFLGVHAFSVAGREGRTGGEPSVWDVPGLERYHGRDVFLTEALALEASAAVEAAVDEGRPFFLHFAPYAVHAPIMANPRHLPAARERGLDDIETAYATMVESVDAALGEILATVERLGETERTIVLFTSDNGGLSAHGRGAAPCGGLRHVHNAPLRSGKGSAYEGGVRVPLVIAWPGVIPPGTSCDVPVVSHDLFPTLLAMAGASVPEAHLPRVEGSDLGPLLRAEAGAAQTLAMRPLFWNQPHFWGVQGPGIEPYSAVRRGRWKLIWFHGDGRLELYDLESDRAEVTNVAPYRPETVAELATALDAWIAERRVQVSLDARTGEPVRLRLTR